MRCHSLKKAFLSNDAKQIVQADRAITFISYLLLLLLSVAALINFKGLSCDINSPCKDNAIWRLNMEKSKYEIGISVGWEIIKNIWVRYVEHEFLARIEGEEFIAPPPPFPYAYINAESPDLSDIVTIPVSHKIDFYNLWVMKENLLLEGAFDVVIRRRKPHGIKAIFSAIMPSLEYSIYPLGYFEDLHDPKRCIAAELRQPLVYLYDQERITYAKNNE